MRVSLIKQILFRLLLILSGFVGLVLLTAAVVLVTFFYNPTTFINPPNLNYALEKTSLLKNWSWKEAKIEHQWIAWNKRRFFGGFKDLCIVYENADANVDTCMETVSWNVELSWTKAQGFKYEVYEPLVIESSKLIVTKKDNPEETPPPDLMSYWEMAWSPLVPDLKFNFRKIDIIDTGKVFTFDLNLVKTEGELKASALGFDLVASDKVINIHAPKRIQVPYDLKTTNPLYFSQIKIEARILESTIPVKLTAQIESAEFVANALIKKSALKTELNTPTFLKEVLLSATAGLEVKQLKSTVGRLVRPPFNILPAPLNAMEGDLKVGISTLNSPLVDSVVFKVRTEIDMKGADQVLQLAVLSDIPLKLKDFTPGPIVLGLELKKVKFLLPRLSRTRLPPQLVPDSRFKKTMVVVKENLNEGPLANQTTKKTKKASANLDVNMKLQALGENALHINTNLLDQTLRLNFDLAIENGQIKNGYIQTFPLATTVFKRKIVIPSLRIEFQAPLEPRIVAKVEFHLPEYKVSLDLEGPLSNPRQAFSSEPPLPIDDIYAVILFGRPLSALDPDDRTAAKKSNQLLSQGILSLAVLYYFAGSPVESLGYDPNSNELSAQIGLGAKNSLRVGGSGQGLNSAGVRRSLGKGWYIDSSVQKSTKDGVSTGDYGVLLERVISY